MTHIVYLAGPITGLTFGEATDWREYAIKQLANYGIKGISPMRAKEYLATIGTISGTGKEYSHLGTFSTPEAVITRDRWDTTRADAVLVNLLGAKAPSIGTIAEIAWAYDHRVPLVCAMEKEGNVHDHMFITQMVKPYRVETLKGAIDIVRAILL